jgi:hypothetical protein
MRRGPFSFVLVDVPGDLRGPRAEGAHEIRQLPYLPIGSQCISVGGERGPELRVAGDRGVPDTVDCGEGIANADGVQAAPFPGREHPGVDLQVQMAVRVPGPRRVVRHRHRLGHLDRHLHLPAPRTDPGGGVLPQPADDLLGRPGLGRVIRRRDVQVQRGRQRPRLRTVDHHLDEPHRMPVATQLPPRLPGARVTAGHPGLIGVIGQRRQLGHSPFGDAEPAGDAGALGEVVVIRPTPVGLDVLPGSRRRASVYLHPAMHFQRHPAMTNT